MAGQKTPSEIDSDQRELEKLGYSQELFRGLGAFSNFAVSFSVISILTGLSQLYGYGLQHGGPMQAIVGWLVVGFFTITVALSMAELASSYPTAGALYHWSSFLGGRTVGWYTACFNAIGMFAILAGIDYGLAKFLVGLFSWPDTLLVTNLLYAGLLLSHAVLNYRGIKVVGWLNDFSAVYHVVVVFLLVGALFAHGFQQPVSFLFTFQQTDNYLPGYSFLVGLLLSQWTLTGYDASAHVTEETRDPGRAAPKGIIYAVVISFFAGLLMLVAVTLSIPNLETITAAGDTAFHEIIKAALGPTWGNVIVFLVAGAMWLCGLSGMTAASRMIYAFARDGGLPYSKILARVHPVHKTPADAIWALTVFAMVLAFSVSIYSAVVSIATVALSISYGIPIAVRLWAERRGILKRGPWHLGKWSHFISVIAIIWITFITIVFLLPPNQDAGRVMAILLFLLVILWFGKVRKVYVGPRYHET